MDKLQNIRAIPDPVPTAKNRAEAPAPREERQVGPEHSAGSPQVPLTREQLVETTAHLQEALAEARPEDWRVGIHQDETTGSMVIEIRDAEGEVVKQFPPEKVLNLQRKLADLAGVVVDETT